jgi:HSP20 family protein
MAAVAVQEPKTTEVISPRRRALTPFRDFPFFLSSMRDDFDRLFDSFSREWPSLAELGGGNGWRWGMEVEDQDDAVVVRAEAPGFEPGDFDLQVRGNQLVLRASKKMEKEEKERGYREEERRECYESVTLPPGINADKIDAKYHNGVLTVTMPKTPEAKPKRISVKS